MLPTTVNSGCNIHEIWVFADVEFFDGAANSMLDAWLKFTNAHIVKKGDGWELLVFEFLLELSCSIHFLCRTATAFLILMI